jgi:WD40 repeat protein
LDSSYRPDGKSIVARDGNGSIYLWEAGTEKLYWRALSDGTWSSPLRFSPDGSRLLAAKGGVEGVVRQLNPRTGQESGPAFRPGPVKCLAWSPDGKTTVTGSTTDYGAWPDVSLGARRWDAATCKPIGPIMKHNGDVWAVGYSRDGKTILTASADGTAGLWNAESGGPLGEPLAHPAPVRSAAISPDDKLVVTGGGDKLVRVWDIATRRPVGNALPHRAEIRTLAVSPDGKLILTGCRDSYSRLWDFQTRKPLGPALPQFGIVQGVEFASDGQAFLTVGSSRSVWQWTLASPVQGSAEQVDEWVQSITRFALDANDAVQMLNANEWNRSRDRTQNGPLRDFRSTRRRVSLRKME